jgi:hypothetical protein
MRRDANIPIILDLGVFRVKAPAWLDKPGVGDEERDEYLAVYCLRLLLLIYLCSF